MNKITISRMSIILTSIVVSYLISDIYENILGFILILSIGVIHGANDLLIIKKYSINKTSNNQFLLFFYYLAIVFIGFAFFVDIKSPNFLKFLRVIFFGFIIIFI